MRRIARRTWEIPIRPLNRGLRDTPGQDEGCGVWKQISHLGVFQFVQIILEGAGHQPGAGPIRLLARTGEPFREAPVKGNSENRSRCTHVVIINKINSIVNQSNRGQKLSVK